MALAKDLDLDAYAQRLGLARGQDLKRLPLAALHRAHLEAIPFENFDVLLKRPMPLDLGALSQKLMVDGRGGYCFETNLLLMAAWQALGFAVRPLAARVLYRATKILPRTHMLVLCETPSGAVIADVGFGGAGLLEQLPLRRGMTVDQGLSSFRLNEEAGQWTLSVHEDGRWMPLYVFNLEHQEHADLEMAHYYVATHPGSRFTQTLVCQRVLADARLTVRNSELAEHRLGKGPTVTALADHAAVVEVLRTKLKLKLPNGIENLTYGRPF